MAKSKSESAPVSFDPDRGPILSIRFLISLVLILGGIAWIAFYYIGVRAPIDEFGVAGKETGPGFLRDLDGYNYLIGFAALMLGLAFSAHPKTPLGRGRGVVVGMLGCFLVGLVWICVYYAINQDPSGVPIFNDLGQKNLFVGISFMAVGFTFATRWE